jgi:hypothetical protein
MINKFLQALCTAAGFKFLSKETIIKSLVPVKVNHK